MRATRLLPALVLLLTSVSAVPAYSKPGCDAAKVKSAAELQAPAAPAAPSSACILDAPEAAPAAPAEEPAFGDAAVVARSFFYEVHRSEKPNGGTIVLLHGSGGDERSLVGLARKAAPDATLIAVRGRIVQDGKTRWYRRLTPVRFDQDDIRREADAFVRFARALGEEMALDPSRFTYLGYSNGANLIGAVSLLHPGLIRKAVLLRPMPVLDQPPQAALDRASYLLVSGKTDKLYAPFAPELHSILKQSGALIDRVDLDAGHLVGDADSKVIASWLNAEAAVAKAAAVPASSR